MRITASLFLSACLAISVFGQSVRVAMVTSETPGAACAVPTPGSSFPIDTPKLYAWFLIDNAVSGDQYRVQWVMADGRVFSNVEFNPTTAGSFCFRADFDPATTNGQTGLWAAIIVRNGTQVLRSVTFTLTAPHSVGGPSISPGGVAEPWTYQPGLSPGGWATLYGTNLASATATWSTAPGELLPTTLAGVAVRINGTSVPVAYVSPGIVNFLAPGSMPAETASVTVERNGTISPPIMIPVRRLNPAIYSIADTSRSPVAFFVTAARAGTAELVGNPAVDARTFRGAIPGESIDLYVTGLGRTSGGFPTDRMFSGAHPVLEPISIDLAGTTVFPDFAGLITPGLYLVRFTVPPIIPPGNQPIRVKSSEFASAANVFLRIQSAVPPLTLESLIFSAATVVAAQSVSGTIKLSGPAPASGVDVQLRTDSGPPATITIAPNRDSAAFTYTPPANAIPRTVTIFARWNGSEKSATLTITAPLQSSVIQDYELTIAVSAVIEGRRLPLKILLSVPNILPYALVDNLGDFGSGALLYIHFLSPAVTGNSVTLSSVNGLGYYSVLSGAYSLQPVSGGSLTVTVPSAALGTPVSGTIQFRTATKNISSPFTGSVTVATRVK